MRSLVRVLVCAAAASGLPAARGADAVRVAPPDAISAARQDLKALKSDAANPVGPSTGLPPAIALPPVPSFGAPVAPAPAARGSETTPPGRAPSRGWLVEGMDREEARARPAAEREELEKQDELLRPRPADPFVAERPLDLAEAVEARRQEEERALAEATPAVRRSVVNPLDTFMGEWLGRTDRELWQKTSAPDAAGSRPPASGAPPPAPVALPPVPVLEPLGRGPAALSPAGPVNPFLENLAPPRAVAVTPLPGAPARAAPGQLPPPATVARPSLAPAPVATPPARQAAPPAARADEQKYFPQLNRF